MSSATTIPELEHLGGVLPEALVERSRAWMELWTRMREAQIDFAEMGRVVDIDGRARRLWVLNRL